MYLAVGDVTLVSLAIIIFDGCDTVVPLLWILTLTAFISGRLRKSGKQQAEDEASRQYR